MIGTRFHKPIENEAEFLRCIDWCNSSQMGYIVDMGEYLECVELPKEYRGDGEIQRQIAELEAWFDDYDITVNKYNRHKALGIPDETEIYRLYEQAEENAMKLKELRSQI